MDAPGSSVGRWLAVVLDCTDPRTLAAFYQQLLGLGVLEATDDWVTLGDVGGLPTLALQRTDDYQRPDWVRGTPPQQAHLDVLVTDLDTAQARVLAPGRDPARGVGRAQRLPGPRRSAGAPVLPGDAAGVQPADP